MENVHFIGSYCTKTQYWKDLCCHLAVPVLTTWRSCCHLGTMRVFNTLTNAPNWIRNAVGYHSNKQSVLMGNESNSMSKCLRQSYVTVNTTIILRILISIWFPQQRSHRQCSTSIHGARAKHLKSFISLLHHKPKKNLLLQEISIQQAT